VRRRRSWRRTSRWRTSALDLLGQARSCCPTRALGRRRPGRGRLAYLRDANEFRNAQLVELPNGDFATSIAKMFCFAGYQNLLYQALVDAPDATLAQIAAKAVKETKYHVDHAALWTLRLGDGTRSRIAVCRPGWTSVAVHAMSLFEYCRLPPALLLDRAAPNSSTVPAQRRLPQHRFEAHDGVRSAPRAFSIV